MCTAISSNCIIDVDDNIPMDIQRSKTHMTFFSRIYTKPRLWRPRMEDVGSTITMLRECVASTQNNV